MSNRFPTLLDDGTLIIRASSTTGSPDCARRTAAAGFPELIEKAGYTLRQIDTTIGAAIGIGVHSCAEFTLKAKVDDDNLGDDHGAYDAAIGSLRAESQDGILYDPTSPNMNIAERQVRRMSDSYRKLIAPGINPVRVERRLSAKLREGYQLSGQADSLAIEPDAVHDLKTGVRKRANHAQLGCYSLLSKTWDQRASHLIEDYIPRVGMNVSQPRPERIEYDQKLCERIAAQRIKRMMQELDEFQTSGDSLVFPANPMSMLCSDKYCPAWGTNFCREHLGA